LDDLIDTGDTLNFMHETAKQYQPSSLKTIVLFDKEVPRKFELTPDYIGIKIPNV
jgi:hypoxanthine-guanine phosphoribosyltransferase